MSIVFEIEIGVGSRMEIDGRLIEDEGLNEYFREFSLSLTMLPGEQGLEVI